MTHFYNRTGQLVRPGTGWVSPTTVLSVRRNLGLQGWKDTVGPQEAERLSDIAKKQGTLVHKVIERLTDGEVLTNRSVFTKPVQHMVRGFENWREKVNPTLMDPEKFVFSEEDGYAGRLDLLCQIDGVWWIIDYKTSKLMRPSMGLQLVAYKKALKEMTGIDARTGILQLTDKVKRGYRFKEFDEPYDVFKAHLTIFKWEQINEPPDYPWDGGAIYV